MSVLLAIPARYGSTRFPGKMLAQLAGKPLIVHVIDLAKQVRRADDILVATDDVRISEVAKAAGVRIAMTDATCASGTDRIAQAALGLPHDIIVNLQGDEPLLDPNVLDGIIDLLGSSAAHIATARTPILTHEEIINPNVVKVVCDHKNRALYFSRSPIPYVRGAGAIQVTHFKHIGVYAYRRDALYAFTALPPSQLEQSESLEQLRALEAGMTIMVSDTTVESHGVDTEADLALVESRMHRIR